VDRQVKRLHLCINPTLWRGSVKMFEKFPKIYNVYFLAIVATMGGMLFGFDISSMSAIIPTDQYL
jgi:hypothetical protein